jgi:rhodanese-related sulfurtransferase
MIEFEKVIQGMDFQFFGTGQHKIDAEKFLSLENAVLLDVRANEEIETVRFGLLHHVEVIEIPANEIPERKNEIPKDKTIGVFCSSGVRASIIYAYLQSLGYKKARIIVGGYAPLMEAFKPGKLFKKINA